MGNTKIVGLRPLGHGWQISIGREIPGVLISDFIRPAIRAVPAEMARQLGHCRVTVLEDLGDPAVTSQWTVTDRELEISLAAAGREDHDTALELLVCLGQALWNKLDPDQRTAYWLLVDEEISANIPGEIDEEALQQKRLLLANRNSAASRRRLERYGVASFAGTAAEYVHCLWHDVTIRTGPAFLPARQLRRRLELLSRWYPPARGHPLFRGGLHRRS